MKKGWGWCQLPVTERRGCLGRAGIGLLRRRRGQSSPQAAIKFLPVRVHHLDEGDLAGTGPLLQGLFAGDGVADVEVVLVLDETLAAVAAGEALGGFGLVLVDAAGEVGRDADIERAVALACEDVDVSGHSQMVRGGLGGVKPRWFGLRSAGMAD